MSVSYVRPAFINLVELGKRSLTSQKIRISSITSWNKCSFYSTSQRLYLPRGNRFQIPIDLTNEKNEDTFLTNQKHLDTNILDSDKNQQNLFKPVDDNHIDYNYFKDIVNSVSKNSKRESGSLEIIDKVESFESNKNDEKKILISEPPFKFTPKMPEKSKTLAPYVNKSECLSNLVKLGIDLSLIEKNRKVANFLLRANFENQIQPVLRFIHRINVPDEFLGKVFSKEPDLFIEDLDHMQARYNYFLSKKFSGKDIGSMISRLPSLLLRKTKDIDANLGILQKHFSLSGDEVRLIIAKAPKLATWDTVHIMDIDISFERMLGFDYPQRKEILLAQPKIFVQNKNGLMNRFDYAHNVIGLSHTDFVKWPDILLCRESRMKSRHLFLKYLGRAQYDKTLENYVSPKSLAQHNDQYFCENIAKVPLAKYNDYLKTL